MAPARCTQSLPGVNHGFAARDSAGMAVDWIAGRFANAAVPDDCG